MQGPQSAPVAAERKHVPALLHHDDGCTERRDIGSASPRTRLRPPGIQTPYQAGPACPDRVHLSTTHATMPAAYLPQFAGESALVLARASAAAPFQQGRRAIGNPLLADFVLSLRVRDDPLVVPLERTIRMTS